MSTLDPALEQRLDRIDKALGVPKYVGVSYIAKRYGVSESYVRSRQYLLPNWGVSDVPGKLLWHIDLVEDWTEVSPEKRQRQWELLDSSKKKSVQRRIERKGRTT